MKIPQFFANDSVPATSGQPTPGPAAYGADAFAGIGELGRQALDVIAQAEEKKADLQRSTMLQNTMNQAQIDYKDFETAQLANPDSETHVPDRDSWSRKYNDTMIGKINDPIVKKAAVTHLGSLRTKSIVDARSEARTMAVNEAIASTSESLDILHRQIVDSGMDPEVVANGLESADNLYNALVVGGASTPEKAYESRKKWLENTFVRGAEELMAADPSMARKYLLDNADEVKEYAGDHWLTLLQKSRQMIEHNETLARQALEQASDKNKYALYRAITVAKTDTEYSAILKDIDSMVLSKTPSLKGSDGEALAKIVTDLRKGGGVSDPETVKRFELSLYSTMGEGVSFEAIYSSLGQGLTAEDARRIAGLKESLMGQKGVLQHSVSLIEKAINPGMMEKWTKEDRTTYTVAMAELMERTNNGNAPPKEITAVGFDIANRLNRSRQMAEGVNPFKSMDDLDAAIRRGQVGDSAIEKYVETMPLPPKWSNWTDISFDWRDGKISPALAKALHNRLFPPPAAPKGKK